MVMIFQGIKFSEFQSVLKNLETDQQSECFNMEWEQGKIVIASWLPSYV